MLTKTIKFDEDVLEVFKAMEWCEDGLLGIITGGQLERDLYLRCNKAYEALGGKWNRKAGGIVFSMDPRPRIEGLIESGDLTVERDGFFETPRAVIERMFELVPLSDKTLARYLKPSAGLGAIVNVLLDKEVLNFEITAIEKNEWRCLELSKLDVFVLNNNFLELTEDEIGKFDRAYMNPPFEELQDIDHVRHAYDFLTKGGAMVSVMSEGPFFRGDKKAVEFRSWLASVGGTSERLPEDSFKESGTGVNARLVVIKKETENGDH